MKILVLSCLQGHNEIWGDTPEIFEEIGKLGRGGFGEVVKARSRMEGIFYAVKKIKHRADKLILY